MAELPPAPADPGPTVSRIKVGVLTWDVESWTDAQWDGIPVADRPPGVSRLHSGNGWSRLAPVEKPAPGPIVFPAVLVDMDVDIRAWSPEAWEGRNPADRAIIFPGPDGWRVDLLIKGDNQDAIRRADERLASRGKRFTADGRGVEPIPVDPPAPPVGPADLEDDGHGGRFHAWLRTIGFRVVMRDGKRDVEAIPSPVEPENEPEPFDVRRVLDDCLQVVAGDTLRFFASARAEFMTAREAINRGDAGKAASADRRSDWGCYDFIERIHDLAEQAAALACLASDPSLPIPRTSGVDHPAEEWPTRTVQVDGRQFIGGGLLEGDERCKRVGVIVTDSTVLDLF